MVLFDQSSLSPIFLFSDGFVDQFGGPNQQKFMSKNLKNLIMETGNLPITKQGELIKNTFQNWVKPNGNCIYQIDDVMLIGFEVQ